MSKHFPLSYSADRINAIVSVHERRKAISPDNRQWIADMLSQHPVGDGVEQMRELKTALDNEIALTQLTERLTS